MRIILTLLRKDFANFFRDRAAVSLTFLVPVALIYIFGQVFGLNRKDTGPTGVRLAVVNQSDNPAAQKLVDALKAEKSFRVLTNRVNPDKSERPLREEDLRPMIRNREFRFALVIPADVIASKGIGLHLKILSDPRNEIETQTVNGLLQKAIFSNVPQLLGQSLQAGAKKYLGGERLEQFNGAVAAAVTKAFGGDLDETKQALASGDFGLGAVADAATPGAAATPTDFFSRIVKIESEQVVGKDVKSPEATRVVGGWAMMFLLFALSASAAAFFDEKKAGLFQRLLSAPVRRSHILWSRFLYGVLLGLVQLTALFFAGRLLYGIDVLGNFGSLLVICTAAAAACTAFGMLLASIAPTAAAANGLATFLVLTMSATGGAWFPVSFMPEFMQTIARFTLVYWSMEGFSQVLWAGQSFLQILPTVGILLGIAAGVMAVAVWRFNRGPLFD
ncbi:MAG: ABC transporter permease [Opitutae bacterium]|nr:ABC transporter permease [Opitutae bacterium]